MSKLTELAEKEAQVIKMLKKELDLNRNLLARILRYGDRIVTAELYSPKDSMQFTVKHDKKQKTALIIMKDYEGIEPLKSDYQNILNLMKELGL